MNWVLKLKEDAANFKEYADDLEKKLELLNRHWQIFQLD